MFEYTFVKPPFKMGKYDDTYGQAWWGEVNERLEPVKFNLMEKEELTVNSKISCESQDLRKSKPKTQEDGTVKEGREYWQLKKVKVVGGSEAQTPATEPVRASQSPPNDKFTALTEQLIRIEGKLDRLLTNDSALDVVHEVPDGDPPMPESFLL